MDSIGATWCHVANERKTSIKRGRGGRYYSPEGNKLKQMGVKSGVPDVLIFDPRHDFGGFAVELKVGNNKPSNDQKLWLKRLETAGWKTLTTWSLDEFIFEIDKYFDLE